MSCGHVQGKHSWGVIQGGVNGGDPSQTAFRCPICMAESERVIQLTMGMESAFHLDSDSLDYAFNPCGHVASHATVRYILSNIFRFYLFLDIGQEFLYHMEQLGKFF